MLRVLLFSLFILGVARGADDKCDGKPSYETKEEDTCSTLTNTYEMPLEEFLKMNPSIDCRNLTAGTVVCVPPKAKQYGPPPGSVYPVAGGPALPFGGCSAGCQPYRVVYGDSCATISQAFCAMPTLYALNPGLNCGALAVGQPVCVPTVAYAPPPPPPPPPVVPAIPVMPAPIVPAVAVPYAPPACGGYSYRVLAGDSCGAIAASYSCSVNYLYQLNPGINCGALAVGSAVCVPPVAAAPIVPAQPIVPALPAAPMVPALPAAPVVPAAPIVPAQAVSLGQLVPGGYYPNLPYAYNPCVGYGYGPYVAARLC